MKHKSTTRFKTTAVLILAIIFAAVCAYPIQGTSAVASYTLSGRVYAGEVGDESQPLAGVSVSVFGAHNPYPDSGSLIGSTTTNSSGWFGLEVTTLYDYYRIAETDPTGYESVGATTVDGIVRNPNWIEYQAPIDSLVKTGNKFWDRDPSATTASDLPDLIISGIGYDLTADIISFTVKNAGQESAAAGFSVQYIYIQNGNAQSFMHTVPTTLAPGQQYSGEFDVGSQGIDLVCNMTIRVCADTSDLDEDDNIIQESNESNNCLQVVTTCASETDPSPPAETTTGYEEEVWCCANGQVDFVPISECEQRGGAMFDTEQQAIEACEQMPEEEVWCCANGQVDFVPISECEQRGGAMFDTEQQAIEACEQAPEDEVWCCANGQVDFVPISECEQRGGAMFDTEQQAIEACEAAQSDFTPTQGSTTIVDSNDGAGTSRWLPGLLAGIGLLVLAGLIVWFWLKGRRKHANSQQDR